MCISHILTRRCLLGLSILYLSICVPNLITVTNALYLNDMNSTLS
jgi:hypothetical protein